MRPREAYLTASPWHTVHLSNALTLAMQTFPNTCTAFLLWFMTVDAHDIRSDYLTLFSWVLNVCLDPRDRASVLYSREQIILRKSEPFSKTSCMQEPVGTRFANRWSCWNPFANSKIWQVETPGKSAFWFGDFATFANRFATGFLQGTWFENRCQLGSCMGPHLGPPHHNSPASELYLSRILCFCVGSGTI